LKKIWKIFGFTIFFNRRGGEYLLVLENINFDFKDVLSDDDISTLEEFSQNIESLVQENMLSEIMRDNISKLNAFNQENWMNTLHQENWKDIDEDPMKDLIAGGELMLEKLTKAGKMVKELKEIDKRVIDYLLFLTKWNLTLQFDVRITSSCEFDFILKSRWGGWYLPAVYRSNKIPFLTLNVGDAILRIQ
jgi:hypothetical protein